MLDRKFLIDKARAAQERAYAPYSGFKVGAALLCEDGSVYLGCNIENASYTPTCCAERVAIHTAVADGKRGFSAIAVVGSKDPCYPCGVCRQVMNEFFDGDTEILLDTDDGIKALKLAELLPYGFKLENNEK